MKDFLCLDIHISLNDLKEIVQFGVLTLNSLNKSCYIEIQLFDFLRVTITIVLQQQFSSILIFNNLLPNLFNNVHFLI